MSSSPSRETVGVAEPPDAADCVSLNTVVSAKTDKTLLTLMPPPAQFPGRSPPGDLTGSRPGAGGTVPLIPPGSSHTLPRRAQSFKSPSAIKSLAECSFVYASPRDALGYATLKRLQQQRIHQSVSHSEALASPAASSSSAS